MAIPLNKTLQLKTLEEGDKKKRQRRESVKINGKKMESLNNARKENFVIAITIADHKDDTKTLLAC